MKSRSDKSNITFPACSPFLPNLSPSLPLSIILPSVCSDLDCFDKLSWRCFESLKQRPGQVNQTMGQQQWQQQRWEWQQQLTHSSAQHSSAQRAVVGVAWAPISTNTLKCCPLNRWKNVNISYALWRCRAEAADSWREERKEMLMIEGRERGKKKRLLVKIFEPHLFTQWAKLCRSAFSFSFSFLSSIFALQHLPRTATFGPRHLMKL